MKTIRIWFYKKGTAKFISHLDMVRLMERAIHKSKLPFWYTEGFNPHVYLTITMPISLGYTGLRESMDVKLIDETVPFEEIIARLNSGLPMDIQAFEVTDAILKPGKIGYSSYEVILDNTGEVLQKTQELLAKEQILVEKKTKKGMKEVDIKPNFKDMQIEVIGDEIHYKMVLPSSNLGSINPRLFFDVLAKECGEKLYPQTARTNCFDENMKVFY